jgi:preprotein translocase subunit Sss1
MNPLELLMLAKSMELFTECFFIGMLGLGSLGFIILFLYNYLDGGTEE